MKKMTILFCILGILAGQTCFLYSATVTHTPVVGAVTSTSARFAVRTDAPAHVRIIISTDSSAWANPIYSTSDSALAANDFFVLLDVSGLAPATTYFYRPEVDGQPVANVVGQFRTFPTEGEVTQFSFLFGSCQQAFDDPNSNIGGIFPRMAAEDALFFLHQGDWIYPDTTDTEKGDSLNFFSLHPDLIYSSYRTRYDPGFPMAQLLRKMPVDYVWDDHDWVNNNCDGTYYNLGGKNSIAFYKKTFPHYPLPGDSLGIWHKFTCGNAEIFVTDNRAQRDPNLNALTWTGDRYVFTAHYQDNHKILGETQMDWLINELKNSTATWKIISSGTPFNPAMRGLLEVALLLQGTAYDPITDPATGNPLSMAFLAGEFADKWNAFPASVYRLLKAIIENNIQNVIFISGDTHTSGLDDGTNSLIPELMAGPLDRTNQQLVAAAKQLFKIDIWNRGGHTYDNPLLETLGNAYGKVTVFGNDSLKLEAISEEGISFTSLTLKPGFVPRRKAGIIVPGGIDFGYVDPSSQGGAAVIAINTSIDTFKITNITVIPAKGKSKILPIQTSATLAPGEAKVLQFGFIPEGNVGDTTQALVYFYTNDTKIPVKYIGAQGILMPTPVAESSSPYPRTYELGQNYPNPFNPVTQIDYAIPEMGHVTLTVYDLLGRKVATLVDKFQLAGRYTIHFDARSLPSGMYIYRLQVNGFDQTRKMVLMK